MSISWTRALKNDLRLRKSLAVNEGRFTHALYRPYSKSWRFYSRRLNEMVYQMPKFFPILSERQNLAIALTGAGSAKEFSVVITDTLPDLQLIANGQCFPLYHYEPTTNPDDELFASSTTSAETQYTRKDAISDEGLAHFHAAYPAKGEGDSINKEDQT